MSSNAWEKLKIASSDSALLAEIQSFIKAKKVIIPFPQDHFSCAALNNSDNLVFLDLSNYNKIEEYSPSDKTTTVQSGITIKDLNVFLTQQKQWLPLSYGSDETSLLEVILTGGVGPYETLFGGLRRHVLGLEFVLSNGQLIRSGGKVVKNVSGYDLTRFLIGSYGYFAIPLKAHLRLYTLPQQYITIIIQSDSLKHLLTLTRQIISSHTSLAYMDIIDCRLLEKTFSDSQIQPASRYVLALQIYGDSDTTEEDTKAIKHLLSQAKLTALEISDYNQQCNFMQFLTQTTSQSNKGSQIKGKRIIDLLLNGKEFLDLFLNEELSSFPFVYRPISQKLHYCLSSNIEQTKVLNLLTAYAKKLSMPLSVAYSDDSYIRIASKLGADTTNGDSNNPLAKIKQNMKSQFDPTNSFNPFVKI